MSTPRNTIAIVYDYDQTLSRSYIQDEDPERIGFKKCYQLSMHADRVKHIAPSDYRPNTHLRLLLEQMVEEVASRMGEERKAAIETGTVRAPKH